MPTIFQLVKISTNKNFLISCNVRIIHKITDSIINIFRKIMTFCWENIRKMMKNNVHFHEYFENVSIEHRIDANNKVS